MLGAYASLTLVLGASTLVGQAVFCACGRRRWSCLAPAVGLAALCALGWWTVRLPGEGLAAAIAIGVAVAASGALLWRRLAGARAALGRDAALALAAVVLASLPFIVEGRFGILGTGLDPDMSQHLFAVDRLASGGSERLISEGYPLGPHSIVVALAELGPSTVAAFDGLTLAVAVAACLAALALLDRLRGWRRFAGALCVGFAYLVAAYVVQGAFKETIQALFVAGFAIALAQAAREWPALDRRQRRLAAVPAAVIAVGSAYVYSFPGLLWLGGAVAVWAAIELGLAARAGGGIGAGVRPLRRAAPAGAVGLGVLIVAIAPELGRMIDFAGFETFDPAGAGLGNLFDRISPLEALGIWPSGDFRVEPGEGAIPALAFYAGAGLALGALCFAIVWWSRRGERAALAALGAAVALWLYALVAGTPYQEAKALVLAAPLVALISVRALVVGAPALVAAAFLALAGGSGVLVLVNGPVGPSGYSPALAELRPSLGPGSTLVFAPDELLDDEHGLDYLSWELRGNRVCVARAGSGRYPRGVARSFAVEVDSDGAVVPSGAFENRSRPRGSSSSAGLGPCPLIEDRARADPSAGG